MLGIIITIALIVYAVKHTSEMMQQKKLIIEKGIDEQFFDIYLGGLWFYIIPPLFELLLPFFREQFYLSPELILIYLPILASLYLPTVIFGSKIYSKFNKGFDYERKIGNKINQTLWIGYLAITFFIVKWLIIIWSRLF